MRKEFVILIGSLLAATLIATGIYCYSTKSYRFQTGNYQAQAFGTNPEPVAQRVNFRVIDSGERAVAVLERKNYAVFSPEALTRLWSMAHGKGFAPPQIDFSKEYVIGVFAGQKSAGGNSVAVAAVIDATDIRTVYITLTKPGDGCVTTQSLTNPYQMIVVPMSEATLRHSDTEIATPCN